MEEMKRSTESISGGLSLEMLLQRRPIYVTLFEYGTPRNVEAFEGESLMVALKRAGLPLLAVCGGKGACGTCKVTVHPAWAAKLREPEKRELRLLAHLKARVGERLSCQISLGSKLNNLEVHACDQPNTKENENVCCR